MSAEQDVICTDYWRKPIPTDAYDWSAWVSGREEDGPHGYGATKEAAVADLKEWLKMEEDHGTSLCNHRRLPRVHRAPPFPTDKGLSFLAKDSDGCWYYVNHAGEWHSCPPPTEAEPGLEAAVRAANLALFLLQKHGVPLNDSWRAGFDRDMAKAQAALAGGNT